ncbi:MAG: hypothetical protein IJ124_05245 [Clostridia bacterium]|nr:hypothetical protein [Clostridia bacterium]MBQ8708089.1 hypothetical protein [Succinivibrionaceae bacterium]MBQ8708135.1 hypothetical protein [Succinivibrionaceae bacterium]
MAEKDIRGTDISAPLDRIELAGKEYPLRFDLACMRVAEDVYEIQYGRSDNFAQILKSLGAGKLGAVMAILYGALLSGIAAEKKEPMPWDEYAEKFRLTSVPSVRELLMEKLTDALPRAEGDAGNPPQTGET